MSIEEIRKRIPCCPHTDSSMISEELLDTLARMENMRGGMLSYSSGVRCPDCNTRVAGAKNSAHLTGEAVDIRITSSYKRYLVLLGALELRVKRIGIYERHVHIDVSVTNPQNVMWVKTI